MKPIKGYESYLVSINGDVYSTKRHKYLTKSYNGGYAKIIIKVDGVHHNKLVHRLVAQAYIPNPENKPQVNHKDGDKANNNVFNLEWCTQSENNIHAFKNGLMSITDTCKKNQKKAVAKKIIDTKTGEIFESVTLAAKKFNKKACWLVYKLKHSKNNDTSLEYLID